MELLRRAFVLAALTCAVSLIPVGLAAAACTKQGSMPDSGTMTLSYERPSTGKADKVDYDDYMIEGTLRWNSQDALDCMAKGKIDWAYEHNLLYQGKINRKTWGPSFDKQLADAGAYLDQNALSSNKSVIDLSFGILRPEKLKANVDYAYSYHLLLPKRPGVGFLSFALAGQVANKLGNSSNLVNVDSFKVPICLTLALGLIRKCRVINHESSEFSKLFIGPARRFEVGKRTCFSWKRNGSPVACPTPPPANAGSPPPAGGGAAPSAGGGPAASAPTVLLAQGPPAPAGYRYAIELHGFAAGATVTVTCYDSVDAGGFFTFQLTTDGAGNAQTAAQCYSGDGPDHWVVAGGVSSNHVQWSGSAPTSPPPSSPPPPSPPQTWVEQQGSLGANTFTNPYNASGMGTKIPPMAWVNVSCKVYAPQIASANPDGYWYRIASAPWNNAYYAVANTFWNGDVPGVKPYVHNTDFAVPNC